MNTPYYPVTHLVADSFSRSARTYDQAAVLQKRVGDHLLSLLTPQGVCLDLGCGTGRYANALAINPQVTQCYALDIAQGMLDYCQQHQAASIQTLQADARSIPLPDNSVDVIFSSLMLQWLGPDKTVFSELQRVLKPNGVVAFSTLLDGTLVELKNAWQQVDNAQHVNHFEHNTDWLNVVESEGFNIQTWQQKAEILSYKTPQQLLRELKALGAHNVNKQRPQGLMGKTKFAQFLQAYEAYRVDELLPATYQVLYGVLAANG